MTWAFTVLFALASQPEHVVSRLFAATSDGPFISYSWGEHWSRLRGNVRNFEGDIAAFVCLGPDVYAGGSEGVFVSDDFGENYRPVESFPGKDVTTFRAAELFALEPTLFVGTSTGLYRSKDRGAEWVRVGAGELSSAVRDTAWPGPQFFAATDGGLFVSEDVGDTWERLERGLPSAAVLSIVASRFFVADPIVVVGTRGHGLYRSVDGGESFEPVGGAAVESAVVHALFWWQSLLLVGTDRGLFLSDDAGDTIREVEELAGHAVLSLVVPLPDGPRSDIIVGTDRGVFKSSDGGETFRALTEGLGTPAVIDLGTFPPPVQNRELPR